MDTKIGSVLYWEKKMSKTTTDKIQPFKGRYIITIKRNSPQK
jgi:hypothetical protein